MIRIMGQALYDAQLEYFRTHEFYNDGSISPFLLNNYLGGDVRRLEVILVPDTTPIDLNMSPMNIRAEASKRKSGIDLKRYEDVDLLRAATVEKVEDYYIGLAPVRPGLRPLSIFTINAQTSRQAAYCRRGIGWIVMTSPATFERIFASTQDDPRLKSIWANVFSPEDQRKIGRWSLVANKVDRQHHFWTSDHIEDGEVITAYREGKPTNVIDGLVVRKDENGIVYPPDLPAGYIVRERVF